MAEEFQSVCTKFFRVHEIHFETYTRYSGVYNARKKFFMQNNFLMQQIVSDAEKNSDASKDFDRRKKYLASFLEIISLGCKNLSF